MRLGVDRIVLSSWISLRVLSNTTGTFVPTDGLLAERSPLITAVFLASHVPLTVFQGYLSPQKLASLSICQSGAITPPVSEDLSIPGDMWLILIHQVANGYTRTQDIAVNVGACNQDVLTHCHACCNFL